MFLLKFKFQLITRLNNKGWVENGFTLIELLVVIVIVAVLSAIALPSFLNSAAKARGTEAKSNLGSINRAQQVYRYENQIFAPDVSTLSSQGVNFNGKYYLYSIEGTADHAIAAADPIDSNQKAYEAGIVKNTEYTVLSIICESINFKGADSENTATTSLSAGPPASASCATGKIVR